MTQRRLPTNPKWQKVHLRKLWVPRSGAVAMCGQREVSFVSSLSGYWGPEGAGFYLVCKKCYEISQKIEEDL
jgi:hypothetical protein